MHRLRSGRGTYAEVTDFSQAPPPHWPGEAYFAQTIRRRRSYAKATKAVLDSLRHKAPRPPIAGAGPCRPHWSALDRSGEAQRGWYCLALPSP